MSTSAVVVVVALLATTASAAAPADTFVDDLARRINAYRAEKGAAPLAIDERLTQLAREHSAAMAKAGAMTHDGFDKRYRASGFRRCVENVGWNLPTPQAQLAGWQHSPPHDRNLVDPHLKAMGLAERGRYVTFLACA
jgi:uncharacterized protein YkwD